MLRTLTFVEVIMLRFRKYLSSGVAALVILFSLAGASAAQNTCIATGDIDCSGGDITIGDVSKLIDFFSIGSSALPCPYQADINGDCVVDRNDYVALMECLLQPFGCPSVSTCCNPVIIPCCMGDPNRTGGDPTIADISAMVDAKFITGNCNSICISGADLNGSGNGAPVCEDITIADISILIDCLFLSDDCSSHFGICP
jgi:hypothetical protein